jgi:hypothetical protein
LESAAVKSGNDKKQADLCHKRLAYHLSTSRIKLFFDDRANRAKRLRLCQSLMSSREICRNLKRGWMSSQLAPFR